MQQRGILLWLLMGMLWLLGGCVAPDGSVIQFQQAPDGTIVSWQVDAPTEVETAVYPPRPILYLGFRISPDRVMEPAIKAVETDGTTLGTVAQGLLMGWSPTGDRFAYLKPLSDTYEEFFNSGFRVLVATLGEEEQTIFETGPEEKLLNYGRQSAWSPDGTQIAIVLKKGDSIRAVLVRVPSGQIAAEIPLRSDDILFETLMDRVQVQWSPDGQKLLLQSITTVVLDLKTGEMEVVIYLSAMGDIPFAFADRAEWLPSNDGVIYLDYVHPGRGGPSLPRLWRKMLGEEPVLLLSSEQLAEFGIESRHILSLNMSPSGTSLILMGIESTIDEDSSPVALVIRFNTETLGSKTLATESGLLPVEQIEVAGLVFSIEWSPDEQALAFQMLSKNGFTIEVLQWSEGTSSKVADVFSDEVFLSEATAVGLTPAEVNDAWQELPTGLGNLVFTGWGAGINMVSWMP